MISPLTRYFERQIWPRSVQLLFSFETGLLVFVGISMWLWGTKLPLSDIKVAGVTAAVLTYASIAFGFCLTGMALSLTIPDRTFAVKMATTFPKGNSKAPSTYSDLIFIFSWAALTHLLVIVLCIVPLFVVSSDASFKDLFSYPFTKGITCFGTAWLTYCVCRFAITILTLSQVGSVYLHLLTSPPEEKADGK